MILYALSCDDGHEFESWFPSGDAFEAQRKRGLVACPFCGSAKVEKQIMAPRVARAGKAANLPVPAPVKPDLPETAPAPQPVALFSEKERELRAMVKALREHVEKNAEHVGGASRTRPARCTTATSSTARSTAMRRPARPASSSRRASRSTRCRSSP